MLEAPNVDLVLVDERCELSHTRDLCQLIRTAAIDVPVVLVVTERGLAVVATRGATPASIAGTRVLRTAPHR